MTRNSACVVVLSLFVAAPVFAQEGKKAGGKKGQPDQAAMMEAWQKAGAPGEQHAKLKSMTGSWTAAVKMWMSPEAPPQESSATAERKSIMGGRFVQEDFKGNFMNQPFTGMAINGYDNAKKKLIGVWVDSMGTGMMTSEGTCNADCTVMTFTTDETDPMTGKARKGRMVVKLESDTRETMEMYGKGPNGKEFKMMEIVYTKKGSSAKAP
jgi:hypothetical protein